MVRNLWKYCIMSFYVSLCNTIKAKHFCSISLYCYIYVLLSYILDLSSFVMYMFLSSQLIVFFFYHHSFELTTILLISSVKALCFSLLNLCHVLILVHFFYAFFMIFFKTLSLFTLIFFFSRWFILFSSQIASR